MGLILYGDVSVMEYYGSNLIIKFIRVNLSSWCLVMVERLFLTVPRGCLQFVIVVFPDHTHLLFLIRKPRALLVF